MKHSIKIGGLQREIDIRPMGEDFIVYRKMYVVPLTRENISQINPGDWREHLEEFKRAGWQQVIQAFLLREVRALGSCAMLGWEGNGVVAKMYFTTAEMFDAFKARGGCHCLESRSMPAVIESLTDEQVAELLKSPSRSLRILCFNVGHFDQRYHGQGIATAMIECLKAWARERGWRQDPRGFLSGHYAADGGGRSPAAPRRAGAARVPRAREYARATGAGAGPSARDRGLLERAEGASRRADLVPPQFPALLRRGRLAVRIRSRPLDGVRFVSAISARAASLPRPSSLPRRAPSGAGRIRRRC